MKSKFLKKVALAMTTTMVIGAFSACGNAASKDSNDVGEGSSVSTESTENGNKGGAAYDKTSSSIFNAQLGDYYKEYQKADSAKTLSEKYALEAVAEAKLLESAVMLPTYSKGGQYSISRVAPYTIDYSLWGTDNDRFHQALVATDYIKAEDRKEMKEKWAELKGTGTYETWAKTYLAQKGYTLKDSYALPYVSDPVTWDALGTSLSSDNEAIVNTYDGLMEYDDEGNLKPALAESYDVSDDGLTYTFHLRKGAKWVDSQGREVAEVKADDFVSGMQHMMDAQAGLEYLIKGVIKNASQYIGGDITDFSQVGVKAADDYTVVYTLEKPCTYFTTMLGYGVFAPMNRSYYESKGGKFGQEYDSSAADYTYAKDANSIAYCGPYLVTSATAKNSIVFSANPSYWNAANINVKTITWVYSDGSDVTKTYNDLKAGTIDGALLNTSTVPISKTDNLFDTYAYISATDATTYAAFYNLNRAAFANSNDKTTVVSKETKEDKERTNKALNDVHFRRAVSFGLDRGSYSAQLVGDELKNNALRNSYTPGTFVSLDEDTTISINGKDTTFAKGTYYGQIVQAQIDADGVKMKVWDPTANDGMGSSDGFDGWYNVDNAVEELNIAVKDLKAEGVTVDAKNPITLDLPYPSSNERYSNTANAFKQSIEKSLNGLVKINLVEAKTNDEWYYAGYYTSYGYEANYDVYDLSGWGPDYGDPKTYLDTFLPDYQGFDLKSIGIY